MQSHRFCKAVLRESNAFWPYPAAPAKKAVLFKKYVEHHTSIEDETWEFQVPVRRLSDMLFNLDVLL